jgi:nucleotide-binding universal stress UspA family protein
MLRSSGYVSMSPREVDLMVEVTRDEHSDGLDIVLGDHDLSTLDHEVHLVKGDAGRVIPALVVAEGINLVVMGTVARTGVAGLVIGNTAERILDAVDCSVLAVKPEGFVSPVTFATWTTETK